VYGYLCWYLYVYVQSTYHTLFFSAQKQAKPRSNSTVASDEESGEEEEEGAKESTKHTTAAQKREYSDEEDENEVKLSSECMYL